MKLAELDDLIRCFDSLEKDISGQLALQTAKLSHLQNYLKFLHTPMAGFTDSILLLSRRGRHHSAGVLLRSLVEAYIQNSYYQASETEARLALATKKSFDIRLAGIRAIQALLERHPNLMSTDPNNLFNHENLVNMVKFAEREIRAIIRANPNISGRKEPKLEELAKECDSENLNGVPSGRYERMYAVQYRFLSPLVHLNILGLEHFFERNKDGSTTPREGDAGGLYYNDAVNIYVALVRDLFDEKVLTGVKPESLQKLENIFYS